MRRHAYPLALVGALALAGAACNEKRPEAADRPPAADARPANAGACACASTGAQNTPSNVAIIGAESVRMTRIHPPLGHGRPH